MAVVAKDSLEDYKLLEECLDEKIKHYTKAFITRRDEVQSKVATHFLDMDITFMDDDLDSNLATKPEAIIDLLTLAPNVKFFLYMALVYFIVDPFS